MISRFGRRSALFAALLLSLSSCLRPSGKVPQQSEPGPVDQSAELSLALTSGDVTALSEMADRPAQTIRMQVFKVEGETRASQPENTYLFPLSDGGIYVIRGLRLGLKEFEVVVIADDQTVIAQGSVRHLVRMGPQNVEGLRLTAIRRANLDLRVFVGIDGFATAEVQPSLPSNGPIGEPAAVKQIFKTYLCSDCHGQSEAQGGLDLDKFPYTSNRLSSLNAIMDAVVASTTGGPGLPMPPFGGPLTSTEVDQLKAFAAQLRGGGQAPPSAQPPPTAVVESLEASVRQLDSNGVEGGLVALKLVPRETFFVLAPEQAPVTLLTGKPYSFGLKAFGPGNQLLKEWRDVKLVANEMGMIEWRLTLSYDEPSVAIRVSIAP